MITLTTDFGNKDPFVGMMKGVILQINPKAQIVDITHEITPHATGEAAYIIGKTYAYFPQGAIHVVVVDPGVGSSRRPLLVKANKSYFIGPDNGVFSGIFDSATDGLTVIHVTADHYFLKSKGNTFHGRDIFAPVAAWLSRGINPQNFGEPIGDFFRLPSPKTLSEKNGVAGEVIYIDRFGNAITNIGAISLGALKGKDRKAALKSRTLDLKECYGEGADGKPHALINSDGFLEIFVYMGSASAALGIKPGDKVAVS